MNSRAVFRGLRFNHQHSQPSILKELYDSAPLTEDIPRIEKDAHVNGSTKNFISLQIDRSDAQQSATTRLDNGLPKKNQHSSGNSIYMYRNTNQNQDLLLQNNRSSTIKTQQKNIYPDWRMQNNSLSPLEMGPSVKQQNSAINNFYGNTNGDTFVQSDRNSLIKTPQNFTNNIYGSIKHESNVPRSRQNVKNEIQVNGGMKNSLLSHAHEKDNFQKSQQRTQAKFNGDNFIFYIDSTAENLKESAIEKSPRTNKIIKRQINPFEIKTDLKKVHFYE